MSDELNELQGDIPGVRDLASALSCAESCETAIDFLANCKEALELAEELAAELRELIEQAKEL